MALAQGGRRKQAVIATKVGLAWQNGKPLPQRQQKPESPARLKTYYAVCKPT